MKRSTLLLCASLGSLARVSTFAADTAPGPDAGPVITLPPIIVADNAGSVAWLYAQEGNEEFLSRCSAARTQSFVEARGQAMRQLRALIPADFLAELPSVTLLSDQALKPRADDTVAKEILSQGAASGRVSLEFLPNLHLIDRDTSAAFAYLDPDVSSRATLAVTTGHLRFLLEKRVPMLPPWLVEGILAVHSQLKVSDENLTLAPFVWLAAEESRALARNPLRPRALLSAAEMFAPDTLRGEGNHHPRRAQTLQDQVALFVRWGLDPRNQVREAFWEFSRRAAEQRVTEALVQRYFGFGFSDLIDRLNDYLPLAVAEAVLLPASAAPDVAKVEPRDATAREVLRLRGEWERLEIPHVQRNHPAFAGSYIAQARRTLHRAYDQGDRDPRLLAALGLCEVDAGDPAKALPILEAAATAGTTRPRVSYEIARLRFAELLRRQPAGQLWSEEEIAPILGSLRRALPQSPQLPEIYGLMADAWVRCRTAPPTGDLAALLRGAQYFSLHPTVAYRLALALTRAGQKQPAADLLAAGIDYVNDDALRARYTQLQAALVKPAPATR